MCMQRVELVMHQKQFLDLISPERLWLFEGCNSKVFQVWWCNVLCWVKSHGWNQRTNALQFSDKNWMTVYLKIFQLQKITYKIAWGRFFPCRLNMMQWERRERESAVVLEQLPKWGCLHVLLLSQHGRRCQFFDIAAADSSASSLAVPV